MDEVPPSSIARTGLSQLMALGRGNPEVKIGLLDGPVAIDHPDLQEASIRSIATASAGGCSDPGSLACRHGTFIAGMLVARGKAGDGGICPGCTLLVRPIFGEPPRVARPMPAAAPNEVATAVIECVDAGAMVLNLSAAASNLSARAEDRLTAALDCAARFDTIVVAAAGNERAIGSSIITRHPWVIPVVAFDRYGRPLSHSNLGRSIGKHGLGAPGQGIKGLTPDETQAPIPSGTSIAVPFVTGTLALLWSLFPKATATELRAAVTHPRPTGRRTSIVPPPLDPSAAYHALARTLERVG